MEGKYNCKYNKSLSEFVSCELKKSVSKETRLLYSNT